MSPRRSPCLAVLCALLSGPALAQAPRPFTAADALDITTWSVQDLSEDGRWLAAAAAPRRGGLGVDHRRDGDPTYIRPALARLWVVNTGTGQRHEVFREPRTGRGAAWSPDGSRLAILAQEGDAIALAIWERTQGPRDGGRRQGSEPGGVEPPISGRLAWIRTPPDQYVAENSELAWSRDGARVLVALRSRAWKERVTRRFAEMTEGPVFVQDGRDPFLAWDDLRREGFVRAVAAYDVRAGRWTELLPEARVTRWHLAEDDSTLVWQEDITPRTDYDVIFGTETKLVARAGGAAPLTLMGSTRGVSLVWSRDGSRYAYAKDGRLWVGTAADTARRAIAGLDSTAARRAATDTSRAGREARDRERFTPVRWSADGRELIASNRDGFWTMDAGTGERTLFLSAADTVTGPRYSIAGWSEDGRSIFVEFSSRERWERGFQRYDRATGTLIDLVRDGRSYAAVTFSRSGARAVLAVSESNRPGDLFVADGALGSMARLVESNPQLGGIALGRTELISYLDVDGRRQHGVVYYPPDYRPGRVYPTVFYVYERFFDDPFEAIANVLAAKGYVVARPSVTFETGYPGEAWLKGVTAAANHLIERGVADSSRLGLQGISYGGYATNLLVTQTHRFKAAINISGKVDIISFYTDSPRLGVRNTHAAEKSQDRIGATLWEQPQKYVEHSAVMFADRIRTPLLLLTGELDSNVPAGNTREMYYALRRLGKDVVWVNYMQGGHGVPMSRASDFLDFHERMVAWYDRHLAPKPAAPPAQP